MILEDIKNQSWRGGGGKQEIISYPKISSSIVALYWEGISINAARANSVSFRDEGIFFDIISVKFTN